jgi:tetratricopeptide (TPR) repeat protein
MGSFTQINPNILGRFYMAMSEYSCEYKLDLPAAVDFDQKAISLAISTENTQVQADALCTLAWKKWQLGLYSEAQLHASESERLARMSGNFWREAHALWAQATCWATLGDYKKSILPLNRARDLLSICGMAGGATDLGIMISQAEVHRFKSEYAEAHNIQTQILQAAVDQDPYDHGVALLNIAGIEISMGAPKDVVQTNLEIGKSILATIGLPGARITMMYDSFQGDLNLREGDIVGARDLLRKTLSSCWGKNSEGVTYCLGILGDISRWSIAHCVSSWTTVFLAHSLKVKDKLSIYKALQFLGDVFLVEDETETAISLFAVAFDGFTEMDVHRNRAECLLRIGDISKEHGDLTKAADLWEMARPLFARSSQPNRFNILTKGSRASAKMFWNYTEPT